VESEKLDNVPSLAGVDYAEYRPEWQRAEQASLAEVDYVEYRPEWRMAEQASLTGVDYAECQPEWRMAEQAGGRCTGPCRTAATSRKTPAVC